MIYSMTGFGKSERKNDDLTFNVEVKSLNNRFIEVVTKMPYYINKFDKDIIELTKKKCIRGKIIVNINILNNKNNNLVLNKDKLNSYLTLSEEIKKVSKIDSSLEISDIINIPDIFDDKKIIQTDKNKRLLMNAVKEALDDLNNFRMIEGENIFKDLNKKIIQIEKTVKKIKKISLTSSKKEFQVLTKKIKNISKSINNLDKDRLYQEIAISISNYEQ